MQSQQPLSQVVPVLVAALVCDVAVTDPSTGKKTLVSIFDRMNVGQFPTSRPLSFYLKLADSEGRYHIEVRYVKADSGETLATVQGEFQSNNRLGSNDFVLSFPVPIPSEGRYEFQVWANSVFLGQTFIDIVQIQRQ